MEETEVESFSLYPPRAFADEKAKMNKYLTLIPQALRTGQFEKGPYVSMVKSGEVYYTADPRYEGPFFIDDSRPRDVKNPQGVGYTLHAAVQH